VSEPLMRKRFESNEKVERGKVFYEVESYEDVVTIRRIELPIYPHGNSVTYKLNITIVDEDVCFETFMERQSWGGTGSERIATICVSIPKLETPFFLIENNPHKLSTVEDIKKFLYDIVDWISDTAIYTIDHLLPKEEETKQEITP